MQEIVYRRAESVVEKRRSDRRRADKESESSWIGGEEGRVG
jgi:hypothetical protein